jgi:hypothetical protein
MENEGINKFTCEVRYFEDFDYPCVANDNSCVGKSATFLKEEKRYQFMVYDLDNLNNNVLSAKNDEEWNLSEEQYCEEVGFALSSKIKIDEAKQNGFTYCFIKNYKRKFRVQIPDLFEGYGEGKFMFQPCANFLRIIVSKLMD